MKNLYLAFRANTIDHVIETTPNEARYFVGYVGWRPGELKSEIDRGLWSVTGADLDTIFRKDTEGLWEELQPQSRRIRAVRSARRRTRAPALTGSRRRNVVITFAGYSGPDVRAFPLRMAPACPGPRGWLGAEP